ncbi:MAG TPA: sigma-70 family RNA polymerase sigma factor, partial [Burkholderiaceae bacterium]|nr:sigma-70 family RNA polymerase sigma factor [Burkholderiaceae bacterium]
SQTNDGEEEFAPIAYLADEHSEPTSIIESRARDRLASDGLAQALDALDARSRRIVEARWLADEGEDLTLHQLAAEFGVSAERIRQIENSALKKMRNALAAA